LINWLVSPMQAKSAPESVYVGRNWHVVVGRWVWSHCQRHSIVFTTSSLSSELIVDDPLLVCLLISSMTCLLFILFVLADQFSAPQDRWCTSSLVWFCVSVLGQLFDRVDLITLVSNVRPYVRTSVRPSTKSFFDFNEIWRVGRGRWVMHDGMQYDPIQGQSHEPFKVGNAAIFKSYLRHLQWELATDHRFWNQGTISQYDRAGFFIFGLVLCHVTFEVGRNVHSEESNISHIRG